MTALPGWYPDPSGQFQARYWDGLAWTDRVVVAGQEYVDRPVPPPQPVSEEDRARIDIVRAYLDDALQRHLLEADAYRRLVTDLERRRTPMPVTPPGPMAPALPEPLRAPLVPVPSALASVAREATPLPAPAVPPPAAPRRPPPVAPPPPSQRPPPSVVTPPPAEPSPPRPLRAPPPPIPVAPSAVAEWWHRARRAVSADLAIHGLAYLGVLLLFAGVFGFVAFAFGEVSISLRPVAELAIALSFFGSAAFLRRRGAPFVADAVELLGGAVLPVAVIAALSDAAPVPPDPEGPALAVTLSIVNLAIAAVYLMVSSRRPTSPLRFLVAPAIWVAVAAAGLGLADEVPTGGELVTPQPGQWAIVAIAVAITVLAARLRPDQPVARATTAVALPGLALIYLLTVSASAGEGWPLVPLLVVALAAWVTVELLAPRLGGTIAAALEAVVVVVATATFVPTVGWPWTGAVAAVGLTVLAEWCQHARPDSNPVPPSPVFLFRVGTTAAALLLALGWPWPSVGAFGLLWLHAVARRARPAPAVLPATLAAASVAVLPFGVVAGAIRLVEPGPGLVGLAAWALSVAIVVRLTDARTDPFWAGWVPSAGAVVTVLAAALIGAESGWSGASALLAAATFALAPRWPAFRVWSAATAAAVAYGASVLALDASSTDAATGAGLVGLALVAAAATWRRPLLGHVGWVGHLATAAAIGILLPIARGGAVGGADVVVLATFAVGWILTATARQAGSSTVVDTLARGLGRPASPTSGGGPWEFPDFLPLVLAVVSSALLGAFVVSWAADVEPVDPWAAVAAAVVLFAATALARIPAVAAERPPALLLVGLGFWSTLLVPVPVSMADPAAGALSATAVVAITLLAGSLRTPVMCLVAWPTSLVATVLWADAFGVDSSSLHLVVLVWGAAGLTGALALDEALEGPRRAGEWVRRPSLRPGVVLGALALAGGLAVTFTDDRAVWGGWSLAVAAVVAVAAVQCRAAWPTVVSWALAVTAWAALVPDDPLEPPWPLAAVAAVLVGIAAGLRLVLTPPLGPHRAWLTRWDLPPLAVAHGTATVALVSALVVGWVPATWCVTGGLAIAVAVLYRHAAWAVAGTALVVVAAAWVGPGWLAMALAVVAVVATVGATRAPGAARMWLQASGMLAAAGGWASMGVWLGWTLERAATATALAAGAIAVVLAVAVRAVRLSLDWVSVWSVPVVGGLAFTAGALISPDVARAPTAYALAAGLAAAAVATALTATPLRQSWLRDVTTVLFAAAAGAWAYGADAPPPTVVVGAAVIGITAAAFVVTADATRRATPWIRPGLTLALIATTTAVAAAATQWPDRPLLVAVLLVAGFEAAALGLSGRGDGYLLVAPVLLLAAWIVFASEALTGDAQWFTVAAGLTLLVMVGLARWRRRQRGADPAPTALVALDLIGMLLVVGAALAQTVVQSAVYALVAIALGLGLGGWGVVTRVRRRVAFAAGTVVLAVALMLIAPLTDLVPKVRGPGLWLTVAGIGLIAILVAAFLERGRTAAARAVAMIREATADWE
jgi:hypothetical protein